MRIAIIGNSAESMLNFRRTLIVRAVSEGYVVHAFAPDWSDETRAQLLGLGAFPRSYFLSRSSKSPFDDFRTFFSLRSKLSQSRPDAVLCYFVKPAIYGTIAARCCGIHTRIMMLEGLGYAFGETASLSSRFVNAIVRQLLSVATRTATATLVLNEEDRRQLRDELKAPNVAMIGGIGIDLSEFRKSPMPDGPLTFLMASRLIAEKGVAEFAAAAARFVGRQDLRFILLGAVDDNPGALEEDRIQSWVGRGILEWPGKVDNVEDWLAACHVFVLPSYYREGVPRSTQEAMAVGRAIITTDNVGCRDTVDHGVNGLLVPSRDVESLISAMEYFMDNRCSLQQMGDESRRLAERRFDANRVDGLILDYMSAKGTRSG